MGGLKYGITSPSFTASLTPRAPRSVPFFPLFFRKGHHIFLFQRLLYQVNRSEMVFCHGGGIWRASLRCQPPLLDTLGYTVKIFFLQFFTFRTCSKLKIIPVSLRALQRFRAFAGISRPPSEIFYTLSRHQISPTPPPL